MLRLIGRTRNKYRGAYHDDALAAYQSLLDTRRRELEKEWSASPSSSENGSDDEYDSDGDKVIPDPLTEGKLCFTLYKL